MIEISSDDSLKTTQVKHTIAICNHSLNRFLFLFDTHAHSSFLWIIITSSILAIITIIISFSFLRSRCK